MMYSTQEVGYYGINADKLLIQCNKKTQNTKHNTHTLTHISGFRPFKFPLDQFLNPLSSLEKYYRVKNLQKTRVVDEDEEFSQRCLTLVFDNHSNWLEMGNMHNHIKLIVMTT